MARRGLDGAHAQVDGDFAAGLRDEHRRPLDRVAFGVAAHRDQAAAEPGPFELLHERHERNPLERLLLQPEQLARGAVRLAHLAGRLGACSFARSICVTFLAAA